MKLLNETIGKNSIIGLGYDFQDMATKVQAKINKFD
jgi:hypothetical protein